MKLKQLTEGLSSVLYHTTFLKNVASILETDEFRLTPSFKNSAEFRIGSKKLFFLSTSRAKDNDYNNTKFANAFFSDEIACILVLDGKALSNNYSGNPVDYWQTYDKKYLSKKTEMEDRIYSDKPIIPNAKRYIREIHVLFKDGEISLRDRKYVIELKKSGIPIWLYDEEYTFEYQIKRDAKPLSEFRFVQLATQPETKNIDKESTDKLLKRRAKRYGRDIDHSNTPDGLLFWIEILTTPITQFNNLSISTRNGISNLYDIDDRDMYNNLDNVLHKEANNPYWIKRIAPIMKRNRLTSPRDIMDFVKTRWESVADK